MRPLGAFLFGRLADLGRRPILMINIGCLFAAQLRHRLRAQLTASLVMRALFGVGMGGDLGHRLLAVDGNHQAGGARLGFGPAAIGLSGRLSARLDRLGLLFIPDRLARHVHGGRRCRRCC